MLGAEGSALDELPDQEPVFELGLGALVAEAQAGHGLRGESISRQLGIFG